MIEAYKTASYPMQDMADTSAEAKPLRRRAAMLLGQWAVKMPATERPAAYRSLITLMSEQDAAVQLAAVSLPSVPTQMIIMSGRMLIHPCFPCRDAVTTLQESELPASNAVAMV